MNQSTRIMFLIGMIFNVLEITALLVGFIGLCMAVGVSDDLYLEVCEKVNWFASPEVFTQFLTEGAVSCAFGVVISAAVFVCAILAQKSQEKNRKSKVWPIVMIVLGALNNVIYLIAGILCLIENQEQYAPRQAVSENACAPAKAEATQTVVAAPVIATEPAKEEVPAEEEVPAKAEPKKAPAKTAAKKPAAKTATKVEKKTVAKTPAKKETAKTTKTVVKKTLAKKPASKPAAKTAARTETKKPAAKPAAKTETKTVAKAPAKKPAAKKAPAKASTAKTPAKKPAAKAPAKATAKKPAAKKIVKR